MSLLRQLQIVYRTDRWGTWGDPNYCKLIYKHTEFKYNSKYNYDASEVDNVIPIASCWILIGAE